MKKSASNLSGKQAVTQDLYTKAAQLLPILTAQFIELDYAEILHQRVSQQGQQQSSYQGLARAQHQQFGSVMIKWQLKLDEDNNNLSDLSHEVAVLKALSISSESIDRTTILAPPVLDCERLQIIAFEQRQQLTILVMPYYPQGSLANLLNNKKFLSLSYPFSASQKQQLIMQAAYLIANLHQQGWLHNDIKPSNILLDGSIPRLLFTDFALAQRIGEGLNKGSDRIFGESANKNSNQQRTINPAGTPAYLASERWQGQAATVQSDIYALGIMVYEVLTETRPFKILSQSSNPFKEWALQHCQKPILALPAEYQHYQPVITKLLAKRIERRYQNMAEVLKDLERLENS